MAAHGNRTRTHFFLSIVLSFARLFFCLQYIWIAKVESLPENVVPVSDGTVNIRGLDVSFYQVRVAKNAKCKVKLLSTMVRCEAPESEKGKKVYLRESIDVNSEHLLRIFDSKLYLTRIGGVSAVSKLLPEHVKECVEFWVTKKRYISWLKKGAI